MPPSLVPLNRQIVGKFSYPKTKHMGNAQKLLEYFANSALVSPDFVLENCRSSITVYGSDTSRQRSALRILLETKP